MEEEIFKIAENIGYIVGKYGGKKEVDLLNTIINMLKFQEKIIKLMAQDIADMTGSCPYDICNYERENCKEICTEICNNKEEYKCFIEYYEKKARASNDKQRMVIK